jgi:hypothetical protein
VAQQQQSIDGLIKIQELLGELGFTLTPDGYYKDYASANNTLTRIVPVFDKGMSIDMQYALSGLSITGHETIPIISGLQIEFAKVPAECREDVMRMLAELAPGALVSKEETFIVNMICTECKDNVHSYISLKGVVTCINCLRKGHAI